MPENWAGLRLRHDDAGCAVCDHGIDLVLGLAGILTPTVLLSIHTHVIY